MGMVDVRRCWKFGLASISSFNFGVKLFIENEYLL
jgi:hypothetical protein